MTSPAIKRRAQPPLILIPPSTHDRGVEFSDLSLSLSECYTSAVSAAGGLPWVCPCDPAPKLIAEMVERADGVMMTGGDDINPSLYAKRLPPAIRRTVVPAHPQRDLFELLLIAEIFRQRKPLLAICRGMQILNIALGGDMIVDIPAQAPSRVKHNRPDRKNAVVHDVAVAAESHLARITGTRQLGVNSSHHQAVGRIAPPFYVTASSSDGIVEAMELKPGAQKLLPYLVAVQFHPERLFSRQAAHRAIFADFVRACA